MDKKLNRHFLYWALLIALGVRVSVFIFASFSPIRDSDGVLVSPLLEQRTLDTSFYQESRYQYASFHLEGALQKIKDFYKSPSKEHGYILALPAFPLLLQAFDYGQGNTIPLAFFYLCLCIFLSWLWLFWFNGKGLPFWSLLLFSIILNPIWFMLAISTDLLFAVFFAIFFISYFKEKEGKRSSFWIVPLLLMLLTRPNGICILLFVIWDKILGSRDRKRDGIVVISSSIILIPVAFFLLPYFKTFLGASSSFTFFQITSKEYIAGLFVWLPNGVNQIVSWLCFAGAKVLYFVGLRPSYGNIPEIFLALRALPGIILLPGLVYLLIAGDKRHKALFLFYFFPVFLGASQDRYNLPIQPLLYYYGVLCFIALRSKFLARKGG